MEGRQPGKTLWEMTQEELWRIFPIQLTEHRPEWKVWYEEEYHLLLACLPEKAILRISHIGSTSLKTIWAKPIVDILVEVKQDCTVGGLKAIKEILIQNGYLCMSEKEDRISFNKGYTQDGLAQKVYHLHLCRAGEHDELYFRDYLLVHPEVAEEYEQLKMRLWKQFEYDRESYTQGKTDFVRKHTLRAKGEFGGRYEEIKLPEKIKKKIGSRTFMIDTVGKSDSRVLLFRDMVLKIEKQGEEAEREYKMMTWLSGKLPVPEVLCFQREGERNYLLMNRIEGEMLCSERSMENERELAGLLADGLRSLWKVDISQCPCRNGVEEKLQSARRRIESGLCGMEDAEPDTYGEGGFENPKKLLEWLERNKPEEQPVFSHGDYCLPNIYARDRKITGFLDLGRSGVSDIYQDIALCYRSLKHNYEGTYGGRSVPGFNPDILFDALDIVPDWNKIKYYILLDELL